MSEHDARDDGLGCGIDGDDVVARTQAGKVHEGRCRACTTFRASEACSKGGGGMLAGLTRAARQRRGGAEAACRCACL